MDFSQTEDDQIDLSAIDTDASLAGDQPFIFLAGNGTSFTGGGVAEVRWFTSGSDTYVEADIGDGGTAEVHVKLSGTYTLFATDFIF